jgi:rubredoxin
VHPVPPYVYDPALGDPEGDIPPGTSFDELPDDWVCSDCGAGKEFCHVRDVRQRGHLSSDPNAARYSADGVGYKYSIAPVRTMILGTAGA